MRSFRSRVISGSLLISGTTIGAGMLGIPLLTAGSGLYPALFITLLVWLFMLATGLLVAEATLWMPPGANILTMTARLLGPYGRFIAGGLFLFLYYCLIIAYIAGGGPLISLLASKLLPSWMPLGGGMSVGGYLLFTLLFGAIVWHGVRSIDRVNGVLVIGMALSYVGLLSLGFSLVDSSRFDFVDFPAAFTAAPVLFSAFGYHNIIPSLSNYLHRDKKALRLSIFCGTFSALIIYSLWQWLIIGAVPLSKIVAAKNAGLPASFVLEGIVHNPWLDRCTTLFGFLAIVTSLLGVALSMVDFITDGLPEVWKKHRLIPTVLTFLPPLAITIVDPTLFDKALGLAGGFGEAFLNGLLPVLLVWSGRYRLSQGGIPMLPFGKSSLIFLGLSALGVFFLELIALIQ